MEYNDKIDERVESADTTLSPSENEPERQYYFMKKCKEHIREESKKLGRPLTACSVCFGCQM